MAVKRNDAIEFTRRGLSEGASLQRGLAGGFALLVLLIVAITWVTLSARAQNRAMVRSFETQSLSYRLLTDLQACETRQRGFLLTRAPAYLDRYEVHRAATLAGLRELEGRSAAGPAQHEIAERLPALVIAKLNEVDLTLRLAHAGDFEGALEIVKTGAGRSLMLEIRRTISATQVRERQRLDARIDAADQLALALLALSIVGAVMLSVLAIAAIRGARRQHRSLRTAAEALASTNDDLEVRVAERTRQLTEAGEEIQRFAYIISHDLRAPLVNVMGFTSELETAQRTLQARLAVLDPSILSADARLAVEEDLPEAIGFIRASTAKMDRLIKAILSLSRDGRRVLTPQPVALGPLIDTIRLTLTAQLEEAGAILIVGPLPEIATDRLALEQVLSNLIENAIKYLQPGRPGRIEVSAHTASDTVAIRIADNGRGIAPADHARVFELFRRAGVQDQPGEGIGLASVAALVRRLGGTISLDSALGSGATFTVRLPRTPLRANDDPSATSNSLAEAA